MPTATKVQLTGGAFQDSEGNVLVNGYLEMKLNQDESVAGVGNICAGVTIKILLDGNGNVSTSPVQDIWGNDVMSPVNSYYRVSGFTATGQLAWGPNNQQVMGSSPFDVSSWVPNQVVSWVPSVQDVSIQIGGVPNSDQSTLNFESLNSSVTITDEGGGTINLEASSSSIVLLPLLGNLHYYTAPPGQGASGSLLIGLGMNPGTASPSIQAPSGNEGPMLLTQQALGSTWVGAADAVTTSSLDTYLFRVKMFQITSVHNWMGLCPFADVASMLSLSTPFVPNFPVIAFRYATDQDSTIKCFCCTDNTHTTTVDTGITPDLNPHIYQIKMLSSTSVQFSIDGTVVGTISSNVPTGTALCDVMTSIDWTEGTATQQFGLSYIGWTTKV